ncbi:MAG: glycoside hydrolase family 127 protein [Clostridiales bacterium]|nr:glycoside hydrolase family 127 protein [Clostridiales bacterium]
MKDPLEKIELQVKRNNLESFELNHVFLTNEYMRNASEKEITYLLSLDSQRLLAGFYDNAGITKNVTRYGGWENLLIGGHTIGHYMTACANAYCCKNTSDEQKAQLLSKLTELVDGLFECQQAIGTGFIFGATVLDRENIELQFDHVEQEKTDIFTQAWVPWYTMHKIMEGLISVASMKKVSLSERSLTVATNLGNWIYRRVTSWSEEVRKTVLKTEYGGMNDCLYDLYQLTGDKKFAKAAHVFDEIDLFEKVYLANAGDHVLEDLHANTTIPKFLGALNRYISYRNDPSQDAVIYLLYAEKFWDLVVNHHTYLTGGNSEWEHFGKDNLLDHERTNCNNETCNVYNMLKMTKKLFMITGKVKYANFYERAFINAILASQNPETGMTTYFQPMATGYFKVYGQPTTKFWCCVGSGMENFSKLTESFYFHKDNLLVVNQYISSELFWEEKGIRLTQVSSIPDQDKVEIRLTKENTPSIAEDVNLVIALRLPDWLTSEADIKVNGEIYSYEDVEGYAYISCSCIKETRITLQLPMQVRAVTLPDCKNVYGFTYGPVVLSALLGRKDMRETTTGVDVTIPETKLIDFSYTKHGDDVITIDDQSVELFMMEIPKHMVRMEHTDQLCFELQHTDANLVFVPHYSQHKERFGLYWYFHSNK